MPHQRTLGIFQSPKAHDERLCKQEIPRRRKHGMRMMIGGRVLQKKHANLILVYKDGWKLYL